IISTILSGTIENSSADNVFNAILIIDILVPAFSFFIILLAVAFFPPVMFANKGMSIITLLPASILALLFFFNIDFQLKFLAIIIFFAISSFYFIKEYRERKEIEEIENSLGDGLLMASSLPKGAHIKDFFYSMCKHAKGRLSTEFCIAHKQIINLVSIDKVMHDLKTRIKSELFEKTMEILEYSFKTGKHVTEKLAELAEDILNFSELKRERISMLSIQKYSLIIGALLIPIILSSAFSIISGLDIIDENFLTLLRFSIVPAYLIMISSLSAIFISTMESNRTAELIYFSFFTITEIFIYFNTNISI
ncbi:MAG: type II secretion system F family protein, partial [Candidatus Anstonellales archaeon]